MATVSTNEIIVQYKIGNPAELDKLVSTFAKVSDEEKESLEVLKQYGAQVQRTGNQAQSSFGKVNNELKDLKNNGNQFASSLKGIGALIAGAFSIAAINEFRKKIVDTTIQFEGFRKGIEFASGSAANYAKNQAFLNGLIDKLGLDLRSTTEAYKQFLVASTLAGQSQEETNKQFQAVSKAATVMRLSADQTQGAFLALGQMMSKGTVQAEELRGQLGERIPGAFSIFARGLGVTEQKLSKMLEKGEVLSKDALPKFAAELEKTFGKEANNNLNGMVNSQNRFNSAIDSLILAVGNKLEPFLKGAYDLAGGIAKQLTGIGGEQSKAAKQNAVEAIAARRTENEIVKQIIASGLNLTKQENEKLRVRIAQQKLLELDAKISEQGTKVQEARIAAAGAFNSQKKVELAAAERELAILMEQDKIYTKIAGVEIVQQKKESKELSDEERKILEQQFKVRKNQLELERQFRTLQGELYNNPNAKLAADRTYYQGLEALQKEYAQKGLDISQAEITNTGLQRKIAAKELKQESDALFMDRYKQEGTVTAITADELKKRLEAQREAAKKSEEIDAELTASIQREAEMRTAIITSSFDLANNLFTSYVQFRNSQLDNELVKVNRNAAEEVRLADGNAQKLQEIEQKRAAKEKEIRTKQFKAEQAAAIARVVFETASMVAKWASNPVTFPLAAIAIANQAAQIGFILAQPVPEFAKGVENFQGGFAIVGEQGPELIKTPKGNMLSPGKPTLTYLPKGSDVITAPKTKEILGISSSYKKGQDKFVSVDVAPIAEAVRSIPVQSLHITERGLERFVQRGNRSTRILNKRRQEG